MGAGVTVDAFEKTVERLTRPLNRQYPRPWMTELQDPRGAKVFIVGKNQAKGFPVEVVGSQSRHLDALFNRNGETCRGLYDLVVGGRPSPTRRNTDGLRGILARHGVTEVLETNVICYSTPLSSDLGDQMHAGGSERGEEIFRFLVQEIRPRVLIVHGADACRRAGRIVGATVPDSPDPDGAVISVYVATVAFSGTVFPIKCLAPPGWNGWSARAWPYLERVGEAVARALAR